MEVNLIVRKEYLGQHTTVKDPKGSTGKLTPTRLKTKTSKEEINCASYLSGLSHRTRNANADVSTSHGRSEFVDAGGFVLATQSTTILDSTTRVVHFDMGLVIAAQFLDGFFDVPKNGKRTYRRVKRTIIRKRLT